MLKKYIFLSFLVTMAFSAFSQHEPKQKSAMWKGHQNQTDDTTSILHALKTGTTHGHFRYYFSNTVNEGALTDYYANAIGGGLRFESAMYHRFQFAVSGFYFFNVGSSNLSVADSLTGQMNRYEIGLFDVEDTHNHRDMDRLEELYLKYNLKNGNITFGRQLIHTPLINLQDGRMRGTGVEGLWGHWEPTKKWRVEGGWLYAISPRSTTKWYGVGETFGLYPQALAVDGSKSNYKGHVETAGVGAISGHYINKTKGEFEVWNYYIDNVLNSVFVQGSRHYKLNEVSKITFAGQFIRQDAINNGGNDDPTKAYTQKGAKAMTFGARVAYKRKTMEYSLNYNRITKDGRYLFPREWGRDPFFTFMPRERNEGFGDVHAAMVRAQYVSTGKRLKMGLGLGYYDLPDVNNVALNKYGMPDYAQVNWNIIYKFKKAFDGLEGQILVAAKFKNANTYGNLRYEFNKVNMMITNVILNYHF